jgi:hypothetical protein
VHPDTALSTAEVTLAAISTPQGYEVLTEPDEHIEALAEIGISWLPPGIVTDVIPQVLGTPKGDTVGVVSVIPLVEWRGAPDLPELLAELAAGESAVDEGNGIWRTASAEGIDLFLWSTGDGFLIAVSDDPDAARAYLEERQRQREPNPVWSSGSCLSLPNGGLPYAPFPQDLVVPCESSHNAEVIAAEYEAITGDSYDGELIENERSYACDKAYYETFGPDIGSRPELVTYMPDEAEWGRGDRYLACVVTITSNNEVEVFTGRMADREDLAWTPDPGDCLTETVKSEPVACSSIHVHEYLGDVELSFDDWPDNPDDALDEACESFLTDVVVGPVDVEIWAFGLGPYGFEQGDRTVRCLAFAIGDTVPTYVVGSLADTWRIISDTVAA